MPELIHNVFGSSPEPLTACVDGLLQSPCERHLQRRRVIFSCWRIDAIQTVEGRALGQDLVARTALGQAGAAAGVILIHLLRRILSTLLGF